MKRLLAIALFLCFPLSVFSQSDSFIDGNWDGYIEMEGQDLSISLIFNTTAGETDGAISIPQQSSFNMPVDVLLQTADSLIFSFETGAGPAFFRASLNGTSQNSINGIFQQADNLFPFSIRKNIREATRRAGRHTEQEITIETDDGQIIAGSLMIPEIYDNSTLVVLVSGSGTQTRNSSVAGFPIFKELAKQLADHGYFSFRYDDRGTGSSTGETDATLPELAGDLSKVANHFMTGQNDIAFQSLVFLGHSQGGLASLLAAEDTAPGQLILLASPSFPGDEIITQQILYLSEVQDIPDDIVRENLEFQQRVYEAARRGTGWDELEQDIERRLREQIDELPEEQRRTLGNMDQFIQSQVSRQLDGAKTQWFKSFIETDPRPLLENINIPTLALFGENDTEVLPDYNFAELEDINQHVTAAIIHRANHLFQDSETGLPGEYRQLDNEFTDGFIREIIHFLDGYSSE